MKAYLYSLALLITLSSCDKIEEPEFIENRIVVEPNGDTIKKVFMEYYTGHQCGTCPAAGKIAENLYEQYGENLIAMEVHAGYFATPYTSGTKFRSDYRTPAGEEMDKLYQLSESPPRAMINRIDFPSNEHRKDKDKWGQLVLQELLKAAVATVKLNREYSELNRSVSITVQTKMQKAYENPFSIAVYLTEDSIIDYQMDYSIQNGSQAVPDFVHRFVLRATLTNAFGNVLSDAPVIAGKEFSTNYTYTLPENFTVKNCALVVVLRDNITHEILQAESIKVKP